MSAYLQQSCLQDIINSSGAVIILGNVTLYLHSISEHWDAAGSLSVKLFLVEHKGPLLYAVQSVYDLALPGDSASVVMVITLFSWSIKVSTLKGTVCSTLLYNICFWNTFVVTIYHEVLL